MLYVPEYTPRKQLIGLGADHRGIDLREGIESFLRARGCGTIIFSGEDKVDSFAQIAEDACVALEKRMFFPDRREDFPDSLILIDQFGSGVAEIANAHPDIIASVAWGPKIAYELTRKNNPSALCIPRYTQVEGADDATPISQEWANRIVRAWLETRFLQDASPKEAERYKQRQRRNAELHEKAGKRRLAMIANIQL